MLINNTEALKSWLVEILEPLCDADSSALARYVLALLKKDKPEKELKRVMIEQLDVFLVEETKPFVERLLEAISTEEYLKTPLPTANSSKPTLTGNEDDEVASIANNTAAVIASPSYSSNNDPPNVNTGASNANTLTTGSSVSNVINQNDSDTINIVTSKVIDNSANTSSAYADKVNTPPIDEVHTIAKKKKNKCNTVISLRSGTFFAKSKLSIYQIILFAYLWVKNISLQHIIHEVNISRPTGVDFNSFCREVCIFGSFQTNLEIGGENTVVEIDETKLGRRKYHRGHHVDGQWIFGGVERDTGTCFMVPVEGRSQEVLIPLIKRYIKPGSIIISDFWKSKTKEITAERTSSSSSTTYHQSSNSQYHQQHSVDHYYHNTQSRNEAQSYSGDGNDRNQNHPRSASPPAARPNAADKENQPRESRRRRASLRSRSRSRSRSNERVSRRSRSRDRRINEREKNQRQFRNKSPPLGGGDFRHDRRRGGAGGGVDRRRMMINNMGMASSDDRSPRFGGDRRPSGIVGVGTGGPGGPVNRSSNRSPISPRSRSPSPERSNRTNKSSPSTVRSQARNAGNGGSGTATESSPDARHHSHNIEGEKRQRCRDFDEKGYCVRGETCPWDHGVNPVVFEGLNNSALISMSLREYNPDAPDLWSSSAPQTRTIVAGATPGALMAGAAGINPFTGVARPGGVMMTAPGGSLGFPQVPGSDKATNGGGPMTAAEYARTAAVAAAAGAGFRAAAPMMPFPFNPAGITTPLQRELIPIPVVDASGGAAAVAGGDVTAAMQSQGKRRFELEDSVAIADGPTKRKIPAHSRLGPRVPSLQNCSLELRKVPRGLNSIAHLNNHFAKFGKIVNIQVSYDGDPEAAIVTFSTHAEANVAYRSTEAVLNNRFIKVFWHTSDSLMGGENNSIMTQQTGVRKNSQYHLNNVPAVPTPTADSAKTANTSQTPSLGTSIASSSSQSGTATQDTVTTTTANSGALTTTATVIAAHVPPPSLRLKNNIPPRAGVNVVPSAVFRKKQEEQVKAVAQLANGLRKRKQELLQSYVKQMKSALEIVERCEPTDPQRGQTLDTIKVLQETIDKLQKEIAAEQEQIQAQIQNQNQPPPPKKSKEQQKKELLDIELELFAQQQEGNDTTAIQKRLEELQRSLGIVPGSAGAAAGGTPISPAKTIHYMQGGRPMPRARASYPEGSTRVDRRPKTIVVTGFASDDADFVLGHFKNFGEITKHDMDLEKPQIILFYATRINAEQAILRGKVFKDKRLQIAWAPVVQTPTSIGAIGGNKTATPNVESKTAETDPNKFQSQEAQTAITSSPSYNSANNDTDANNTDTLPELRLEDEEEDEESEDRSWRR